MADKRNELEIQYQKYFENFQSTARDLYEFKGGILPDNTKAQIRNLISRFQLIRDNLSKLTTPIVDSANHDLDNINKVAGDVIMYSLNDSGDLILTDKIASIFDDSNRWWESSELSLLRNKGELNFLNWKSCPITGQNIDNPIITDATAEYNIIYNGKDHSLKLANIVNWFNNQSEGEKQRRVLQAMLYNDEWPIEKETFLTPKLVDLIMRFGDYPKNFDEKLNYLVLKLYLNGAKEYKKFNFKSNEFLTAYSEGEEEFARILNGLVSRGLAENNISKLASDDSFDIQLTEKGLEFANSLNLSKLSQEPKPYTSQKGPRVMIVSTKEDDYYHKKLTGYISNLGFTYSQIIAREDMSSEFEIDSASEKMYKQEVDYVIFLSSASSDTNTTYRSIVDIAIQVQKPNNRYKFFYVSFVDDAQTQRWPRLSSYDGSLSDFRLIITRKRIVADIQTSWANRQSGKNNATQGRKYDLQKFDLSADERLWLQEVYQKFLKNEAIDVDSLFASFWEKVADSFKPSQINRLLLSGDRDITLLGIWQIHPELDLFEKFDDVAFVIRDILSTGNKIVEITSEQIIEFLPHITIQEVYRIFVQMGHYGLRRGIRHANDFSTCSIAVNEERIYEEYRNYNGLQDFMTKYLKDVNIDEIKNSKDKRILNDVVDVNNPDAYKTAIAIKDRNNIDPVMGVKELAKELAEIIDTLFSERGQMIGIFGKWGRGKTFLLNELWQVLENRKSPEYIKIEYHAWKYQETPASWAYLYELFADQFLKKPKTVRPIKEWSGYFWRMAKLNWVRVGAWPIIAFAVTLGAGITTLYLFGKHYDKTTILVGAGVVGGFLYYINELNEKFSTKATALIKKYTLKHSFKQALGMQADVQEELQKLLKVWVSDKNCGKKRIVLIVEDIDRCKEEKVIEIVDALRIMLEDEEISKRVIILAAIDERILKNNVAIKYKSSLLKDMQGFEEEGENNMAYATERINLRDLISEYLDKAFIFAIKLGELDSDQRVEYLRVLVKQETNVESIDEENHEVKKQNSDIDPEKKERNIKNEVFDKANTAEVPISEPTTKTTLKDDSVPNVGNKVFINDEQSALTYKVTIVNQIQIRLDKQNKFEKLTAKELNLMFETVKSWDKATPRKIRIFYYRYLLCKNMLLNKYFSLQRITVWHDEAGIRALLTLLLRFSNLNDPTKICAEKSNVSNSHGETIAIPGIDTDMIHRTDYLYLLEILELVIAY